MGVCALLQLLGEALCSPNQEVLRLNFARTMAQILKAKAVQLMGLDVTGKRCVPLGCWPQQMPYAPEFDLAGRGEAERLVLFALKAKRFDMERLGEGGGAFLLSSLKAAIFGSDQMGHFALIPAQSSLTQSSEAGESISPLIFFALLEDTPPSAEEVKMACLYASYCRNLNQTLLDLTIRAGSTENLAKSLARIEKDRKKMHDALSDLMSHRLVGSSAPMRQLRKNITRFAPSDAPIFIHGETGTGKELAAREIHRLSSRREKAFVAINVTALPKGLEESELFGFVKGAFTGADNPRAGLFAQADGGTLFFDEIGDMSLDLQAKILRVLQERSFRPLGSNKDIHSDFRLISATHRHLEDRVAEGLFREDLFYRLTTFSIEMPPLRAHLEDMEELCSHFLAGLAQQNGSELKRLSGAAVRELTDHAWPGNVRQLHALLLRASYLSEGARTIEARHIREARKNGQGRVKVQADHEQGGEGLRQALETYERALLHNAYQRHGGNRAKMAEQLQIPLRTLADKMKKYELERKSDGKTHHARQAYALSFSTAESTDYKMP